MEATDDFMIRLLLVLACLVIGVDMGFAEDSIHRQTGWIEGVVIFLAVFIVVLVLSCKAYKKEE